MNIEITLEIDGIEVEVQGVYIEGDKQTGYTPGESNEFQITFVSEYDDYYIYENHYDYLMKKVEEKVKSLRDEKLLEEGLSNLDESFRGYYGAY